MQLAAHLREADLRVTVTKVVRWYFQHRAKTPQYSVAEARELIRKHRFLSPVWLSVWMLLSALVFGLFCKVIAIGKIKHIFGVFFR